MKQKECFHSRKGLNRSVFMSANIDLTAFSAIIFSVKFSSKIRCIPCIYSYNREWPLWQTFSYFQQLNVRFPCCFKAVLPAIINFENIDTLTLIRRIIANNQRPKHSRKNCLHIKIVGGIAMGPDSNSPVLYQTIRSIIQVNHVEVRK